MILIKYLHVTCAVLSFLGFFIRGLWMIQGNPLLQSRLTKTLPHIIDTALLASAVTLAYQWQFSPLDHSWLAAKIIALIVYIVLGSVSLKRGKTKSIRITAWLAALLCIAYIVAVAFTKSPWILHAI